MVAFLAQKPIFTNGLITQIYIVPGKLSEPQSGTADLLRILRSSMKEIFLKLVLCLDGIKTKKALS